MAGILFTSPSAPTSDIVLNGGLNSTAGALALKNNESSDLQNIDFNKFGSILQRNGYAALNTSALSGSPQGDGLWWFEFVSAGSAVRKAIKIADGKIFKMDSLDGTWDNITICSDITQRNVFKTVTGLDDVTFTGTFSGSTDIAYKVEIDGTGTPDTFEWFKDGVSQASGVAITGAAQLLDNGVSVTFAATTGHTSGDDWTIYTGVTITATNQCDFETFLNKVYITNGVNAPFEWNGTDDAADHSFVPPTLTKAKYVSQFNNYLFYANVEIGSGTFKSRKYWSGLKDTSQTGWSALQFIDVSKDDGEEITRIRVLRDRLVTFKERSIYNTFYTGDADIPFILPGGGKSNSPVGCIAPFSVQDVVGGHVFYSTDGFYWYDGLNSNKISDRITTTLNGYNETKAPQIVSLNQRGKNRYMASFTRDGQTTNDRVVVWDYFNNAFSIYVGLAPAAMAMFYVNGTEERPYFSDYSGFTYRMDTGGNDYPLNVKTAISSYYYTNWKYYNDLVDQKGVPNIYIYYQSSVAILTFSYSFDFEEGDQFTQTINTSVGGSTYGSGTYGTATYASSGGAVKRRDLTSRGRVVRFKFANSNVDETWQVDGFGSLPHLETKY